MSLRSHGSFARFLEDPDRGLEARIARHRAEGGIVMLATHMRLALDGARGLGLGCFAAAEPPL